jgi:RimJ/RimL family protein N-acetyltransferase
LPRPATSSSAIRSLATSGVADYATEAASACLAAGLEHLAVPRIVSVVDADNETSLRVAARIGMEPVETIEAYGRPHVLFAAGR